LRDGDGHVVRWYGVNVDIDDQKKLEEALRTTQAKLSRASEIATVSELAASIAHEISQPLAALVANGHAIQRWLSAEPPNLERAQLTAERIIRDGAGAAEVVNRIRALFKRTDLTRTPLDLNEVIGEVNRLMTDEVGTRNVRIVTDLADDLPPIWADRVQMQQVIANLARNGVEAMESEERQPKVLVIRSRRDGTNSVLIEIRDSGSGLEDVEKVFEPFFTTKQEGMGMGLAICRWIVEAHQGRLWATKNTPRGAVFTFTLPVSSRAS
jgi:C4-dicarboxylate-specific signal transduction histidine kinase